MSNPMQRIPRAARLARSHVSSIQAADPPVAKAAEAYRDGEEDPGLQPLEGPVPAGRLVGDFHLDAVARQARREIVRLRARLRRHDDRLSGRVDRTAAEDPVTRGVSADLQE